MAMLKDVSSFFIALAQDMSEMDMGDAMTNLRLQKMLYFAQGWMLTRHGVPLFQESIEAWKLGPVVPQCYEWYKGSGCYPLRAEMPPREAFTTDEYEVLLDTWTELSKYSTSQLINMTHEPGTPWDTVWNHSKQREIKTEDIKRFFSKMPLADTKDKIREIPVADPLYRMEGVPVFSFREVWEHE